LIVDLDQTIIHTTVDPTVGEWMTEIEEDERDEGAGDGDGAIAEPQADGAEEEEDAVKRTRPSRTSPPQKVARDKNSNVAALKDVARFLLADELPPGYRGRGPGRWYYTKPRYVPCPFTPTCLAVSNCIGKSLRIAGFSLYPLGIRADDLTDPASNISLPSCPIYTRCMSTQWAREATPTPSAP